MVARALLLVRQFLCSLHGHDALLHFEEGRMSMKCTSCDYETPGWDCRGLPPASPMETERRVVRLPLVGSRRVA